MAAVIQRPLRGSRISTFYPVKKLPSLASLDSAFQLQEYISLLIRLDVHDVDAIVSLPGISPKDKEAATEKAKEDHGENAEKDTEKGKNEVTVDEACWIYEQLRRLAQDLSHPLITTLQQECTRASCPEMKAGEWLYLCVAHGNDGAMEQCCAIDYILHTVDSATALLNSPRTFPSRLSIPQTSHRHFSSLARRLGRIFAHAYFHHREAFEQAEAESSLYARFLALTAKFDLVPAEFLVIPSAQFVGEESSPGRDRDHSPHGYNDNQRRYPSKLMPEVHNAMPAMIAQKYMQHQQQLGVDRTRSPNPPGLGEGSGGGGISENPPSASRSRFGRNRTDTMVFADAEASAVADELAAKARAGELEPEDEPEGPKTARHAKESEKEKEEDESDLEGETQFEISLSPEEEILGTFADIAGMPTHLEGEEEEHADKSSSDLTPSQPETALPPTTGEEPEEVVEEAPPVVPLVEEENQHQEEKAIEPIPAEEEKAPEAVVEPPVLEEAESEPTPSTSTPPPLPEEPREVPVEKEAAKAEPPAETPTPAPEPAVVEETVAPATSELVEPTISSTVATQPPSEEPPSAPEPASAPPPPAEHVAEPTSVDAPSSHTVEATPTESTKPEESTPAEGTIVPTESGATKPEAEGEPKASAEAEKDDTSVTAAPAESAATETEAAATASPEAS